MAKKTPTTIKAALKDAPQLIVEKRKIKGRKVKKLRKEGILPANIYGRKTKSLAVQTSLKEAEKVFAQVGETGLVELTVKGEKQPRPVLLHNPQYDPVSNQLIHLDFYQVDLSEKVTATVPIEVSGEAPAVEKGEGILVMVMDEVEVEALPTDLPEKFVVDVSSLEKVDDAITIADLKTGKEVEIKAAPDQVVVKIEPPTKEEEAPPPAEEEEKEEEAAEKKEEKEEEKKEEVSQTPPAEKEAKK